MNPSKPTLAIYAIQDRLDSDTPYFVHDHGITLMHRGKVIKHLTYERHSRSKHCNKLHRSLFQVLKDAQLLSADVDVVFVDNVVGRAMISACGKIRFEAPLNSTLLPHPEAGRCWWLDKERKAYALNHELAHLGSCLPFYGTFKKNSLLIHFDGGASHSNFSAWYYDGTTLRNIDFHWRLKYLSSFFNANALVFAIIGANYEQQNSVPGKMMGLASYGSYSVEMEKWLVENDYFSACWGKKTDFYKKAKEQFNWSHRQFNTDDPFLQNIVATLQHIFIRDLLKEITKLQHKTQAQYLYYSGGSALNIVANKALLQSGLFRDVFIPPCPDDSGLTLGAAAFVEWQKHGNIAIHPPYLNNWGITDSTAIDASEIDRIAKLISQNKVIGICNGPAEIGPRALGNRSIIAAANNRELAQKVSMQHKGREWYRPVAPILLQKNVQYYTGLSPIHHLANFMLLDFDILPDKQSEMEGCVHVDGSARIQAIRNKEQNPFMHQLLTVLDTRYQIKALINTSFNKRGEPIVHTPQDAICSAKNMQLDALVINGRLCNIEITTSHK
ncbi:carbamoyltransferase [Saccharicrinis carchari]|uniref:Carbamoyltransferase n=1 Tax=Saccharicrinis carchari TaxID=1168039 RepID=A0A521CKZ8_SACCC|nr:carbamoyltransferase C-terminal domain-containing protein [Saccharicrinis carchari]SMO60104.1 carbamoyltransferase [Saccharicrinis carchari]